MLKVLIIGGGPAGMMSAIAAAQLNNDVTLIEKNEKLGKKMFISGKGRCNFTNDCEVEEFFKNVISNPKFVYGSLYSFSPENVMDFFVSHGLKIKTERGNRVFPLSDKSSDVIRTLEKALESGGVRVKLNERVTSLIIDSGVCVGVKTEKGEYKADKVIVATGGVSYKLTGAASDGYKFAQSAGHSIVAPVPALAPINTKFGYRKLAGLSLKNVAFKVEFNGKPIVSEFGEMLFTHEGVSGPIVLTASSKINRYPVDKLKAFIDFKPALDFDQLDKRIIRDFDEAPTKQLKNAFDKLLPSRMIDAFIDKLMLDKYKKVSEVSRAERQSIVKIMKNFPLDELRFAPIDQAIVTAGGVCVKEVDPSTMQSKLCKNLYFAGEVLDIDALTGGFNIQLAFSTGHLAGISDK
ncbi:MAG: NAD(P)/FAD-dependent oxidoreductase [Clostridia bacterium]|nr:NAD(P)/FAD-dependent oxidoreductase [Clostridia bacterium]